MAKTDALYKGNLVAEIVAAEMKERGYSRKEFCAEIGYSGVMLSKLLNGEMPPLAMVLRVCDVLHKTPDFLLGYMDDPAYMERFGRTQNRKIVDSEEVLKTFDRFAEELLEAGEASTSTIAGTRAALRGWLERTPEARLPGMEWGPNGPHLTSIKEKGEGVDPK